MFNLQRTLGKDRAGLLFRLEHLGECLNAIYPFSEVIHNKGNALIGTSRDGSIRPGSGQAGRAGGGGRKGRRAVKVNYKYEKRQKDLAKQRKKNEKLQKKAQKQQDPDGPPVPQPASAVREPSPDAT